MTHTVVVVVATVIPLDRCTRTRDIAGVYTFSV